MINKKNRGFSMVEILVALTLCTILIIPIASSLISSIKQTSSGKELQARNDFAQTLVEYAKSDSLDNIKTVKYFENIGSYDVACTPNSGTESKTVVNPLTGFPESKSADWESYTIEGSVNLGTEHTKYSYIMQISNNYYANKELDDTSYVNPNNLALGVVEDLDYTKVALINGTISNYDTAVSNAFTTRKMQLLKKKDPAMFEQFSQQVTASNPFYNDKVERKIIIKVSDATVSGKTQYTVSCILHYTDDSVMTFKAGGSMKNALIDAGMNVIEYVPYTDTFEELPNIYLMYNVCVYNGFYSPEDYILFDLSELNSDIPVNAFIVETAENYSDDILEVKEEEINQMAISDDEKAALISALKNQVLYDNKSIKTSSEKRDDVEIYVAAKTASGYDRSKLCIYHNFNGIGNNSSKTNSKINTGVDVDGYAALNSTTSAVGFKPLNEAVQESRGLYDIKVWMVKGEISDVDTSKEPILTGTKGGSES